MQTNARKPPEHSAYKIEFVVWLGCKIKKIYIYSVFYMESGGAERFHKAVAERIIRLELERIYSRSGIPAKYFEEDR